MRTVIVLGILLFTGHVSLLAQDLASQINQFNADIVAAANKHIRGSVWVYDSKVSSEEELSGTMELWIANKSCLYTFMDIKVIQNEDWMVQIDDGARNINVYAPSDTDVQLELYDPQHVSEFISQADTIKPISSMPGYAGYRLEYGSIDDGIEAVELFFDYNSGQLKEIRYHYKFYDWVTQSRSVYRVRLVYDKYDFPEKIPSDKFSTDNIITRQGSAVYAIGAYKAYALWVDNALFLKP